MTRQPWGRFSLFTTATVAWAILLVSAGAPGVAKTHNGSEPADLAKHILDATGVKGGLIVHVGCGDGRLTASLRINDRYLVHGLDTLAGNVNRARKHLQSLDLYGSVSVDQFDGAHLPYADNLANLIVVEKLGELSKSEIMRVLCPNGEAHIREKGEWRRIVKSWPKEIDEWTHYLHDATGNAVAKDTVVGPPRQCQWIAPPQWARSHDHLSSVSALVSSGGRIFYIVDEAPIASVAIEPKWFLVARDAFSGVLLWKRPVQPWEGHLRGFRSGPTELARRLVSVGDRVYVTLGYGKPVSVLDAATGDTISTYEQTENALEIIWQDATLFVVVGDRPPDNTAGAAKPVEPENVWHWWPVQEETPPRKHLVALQAETGVQLWKKDDADTAEMMPTTLAAAGQRVFFQSQEEVLSLDALTGVLLWRAARTVNRRRPSWSAPTLVVYDDVVLSADRAVDAPPPGAPESEKSSQWVVNSLGGIAPEGQIIAFAADTGERIWESACRECYNAPVDVLVADGLVWSGNLVRKKEPGVTNALDVKTGKVKRTRPADQTFFDIGMGHHRCYRNKATEKYLVLGRDGIELVDVATGEGAAHAWVRGSCQYGVMPSNGLIYAPPHSCACHIESKLNSFNALAPAGAGGGRQGASDKPRLEKGPAYADSLAAHRSQPAGRLDADWPTYRHDALRSGRSSCVVPSALKPKWKVRLPGGRLSSPVVANERVFVACVDAHTVCALDASTGELLWSFITGGRVNSPPTICADAAIFGSADGWIYRLRASDGELAWRFRAAPADRRIVCYDQVESAWPVHGSVLVLDGVVYAVAGRSSHLEGGMLLYRLNAATGERLSETAITSDALPDVLSSDGASVYLRHRRFDRHGVEQPANVPHLYSPAGFLDDSWWHRTYWLFGAAMRSGWGGWPLAGSQQPAGRLLVLGDKTVYGFGRLNQYHRNGSHVGLGKTRHFLYASANVSAAGAEAGQRKRRRGGSGEAGEVKSRWSGSLPLLARSMLLSDETLFVAGPPDVFAYASEQFNHPYHVASVEALREQEAALAGKRGGLLWAVSTADGGKQAELSLENPPVWDGMAAARGRLYMTTTDGGVRCFAGR